CSVLFAIAPSVDFGRSGELSVGDRAPRMTIDKIIQGPCAEDLLSEVQGKAIVVEFWASWCCPCVLSMPHVNDLAVKFEHEPVRFLWVSDESEETVSAF